MSAQRKGEKPTPLARFKVLGIGITRLVFTEAPPQDQDDKSDVVLNAGSAVQIDGNKAEVRLDIKIDPTRHLPYSVIITAVGSFQSEAPKEAFDQFCRSQAPAIMFPYVRTAIHDVTAKGRFGPLMLPILNTSVLFSPKNTPDTVGQPQP